MFTKSANNRSTEYFWLLLIIASCALSSACRSDVRAKRKVEFNELDQISYALQHARSWHTVAIGTLHGQPFETSEDVFCPSDFHTVTHSLDPSGKSPMTEEYLQTNDTLYVREGVDPWSVEASKGSEKCRLGPMVGTEPLLTLLYRLKGMTIPLPAQIVQSKEGPCRLWNLVDAKNTKLSLASVCDDETTHLPYEFHQGAVHVQYSNWNMPIVIMPPPDVDPVLPATP